MYDDFDNFDDISSPNTFGFFDNLPPNLKSAAIFAIPFIIADFFMSVDSISWCFVSGIHNKKLVVVIRNDGIRKNAGKLAKKRFSELGSAGGHKSMARAEIPLEELNKHCDSTQENKVMQWLIKRLK